MSSRGSRGAVRPTTKTPLRDRLQWLLLSVKVLLFLVVIAGAGYGASLGYQKLNGPVELIVIKGDYSNVTQAELAAWVEPLLQGGMISLDLEQLREGVKTHPWIARARVSRQWPDGILIEVEEELPVARWGTSGFLNSRGQSLQITDNSGLQELPLLTGPSGWEGELMNGYREMAEQLLTVNLQVDGVAMSERGSWRVSLQNGPVLLLGRNDAAEKMKRFLVVWRQQLEKQAEHIELVDLRYDNGVAVRWQPSDEIAIVITNKELVMVAALPEQV